MSQRKERDGLRLSFAMPMIQWDSNPTVLAAIRLWETFTFTLLYPKLAYSENSPRLYGPNFLFAASL